MLRVTERRNIQQTATIPAGDAVSAPIALGGMTGGGFITPAALDVGTWIGFKVSHDGATFAPLKDSADALVQVIVDLAAANGYPLPEELYGARYFQIWTCTAAGVDVPQAADRAFEICLTS